MGKQIDKNGSDPSGDKGDIAEAFDLVKAYAKQETVDPFRTLGGYLKFAIPGALLLAIGWFLLLIGLLRLLQTELDWFDHRLSFVPYAVVLVVGAAVLGLFAMRVMKGDRRV